MKKIFKFAALVAASLAIFSCTPEENPGNNEGENNGNTNVTLNENLKFTFGTPETEATQATIRVEHNGAKTDTWYWIVTTESDVNAAITAEVAKLTAPVQGLKQTTRTDVIIKDLNPETEYTFAAFGLSEKLEVYGETKSVKFTTDAAPIEGVTETEDWTFSYSRGEYEGEDAEVFEINCESNLTYFIDYISKAYLEYYKLTLEDYVLYVVQDYFPSLLNSYTLEQLLSKGPATISFPRMEYGEYYIIAIGYTPEGQSTGVFSADVFTVEEEEAEEEYTQWIGTWDVTSNFKYQEVENGPELDGSITYRINLEHYDNNNMYIMTGWEEVDDEYWGLVDVSAELGTSVPVPVYYKDGKLEFYETGLTTLGEWVLGFLGAGSITSSEGENYPYTVIGFDYKMASAETADGKTATITGNTVDDTFDGGYQIHIEYLGMFFCKMNNNYDIDYWNSPLEFPLDMVKVENSEVTPEPTACAATLSKMNKKVHIAAEGHKLQNGRKFHHKAVRKF